MARTGNSGGSVELTEGTDPADAVQLLSDAAREAGNVLGAGGAPVDTFNRYLAWAAAQERLLGNLLTQREIERLLTTRRYWAIQAMDPIAYGATMSDLIALEVNGRIAAFNSAKADLEGEIGIWHVQSVDSTFPEDLHAVVVDTNVLMRSKGKLADADWPALSGTHPTQSIAITIPAVVVEELDDLKHSNGKMTVDGEAHDRKWLATLALGWLQRTFPSDERRTLIREATIGESGAIPRLYAVLMSEPLDHVALPKADSEIIDTAFRLRPLAKSVTLVSYDTHMVFAARHLGLRAALPPEPAEGAATL
ncbi:PIN domain-containing protein [Leifsonia sp. NPDC058292]|uniref:PIN domain-containing protein n=1 Tax=Leifsonia sp. NPDC058292 TaxID=3346428 RepID=UPI0036DEC2EC